jgi:hypothetical protein
MTTATAGTVDMDVRSNLNILSLGKPVQISHEERIITCSIDAGGSQAISQLCILEHLMEKISHDDQTASQGMVKRPCEVFDVIGGVGTGGWVKLGPTVTFKYWNIRISLVAIFLVVFKMTAEEALEEFTKFVVDVYRDADQDRNKQTKRLEGALDGILERHKIAKETKLIQAEEPTATCKL